MTSSSIEIDELPGTTVHMRRSGQSRRMSLRVSSLDGKVTLTMPPGVSARQARRFIADQADWLQTQLKTLPDRTPVNAATSLPFEGNDLTLAPRERRSAGFCPDTRRLLVPQDAMRRPGALLAFFKLAARDRLIAASDRHARAIGREYTKLALRDTRSRWGSCSSAGALMYSWRLIMAPTEVLDYVAAHEVCHLAHMHHGPDFWDEVEGLYPNHKAPRKWLRDHGASLHKWDFRK